MAHLCLRLLGPFQATLDDRPIAAFETDKDPALLAYLAAESEHAQRREALAELLWPNRPEAAARANLRHTLATLRRAIGDRADTPVRASGLTQRHQGNTLDERSDTQDSGANRVGDNRGSHTADQDTVSRDESRCSHLRGHRARRGQGEGVRPHLLVDRDTVQFSADSDCWVDVAEFGGVVHALELTDGEGVPSLQDPSGLEDAIALYRGPFLEGMSLPDSAAYEEWVLVMRERWQRRVMDVLQRLSAHWQQRGEHERALQYARRQVELEPWHEAAQRAMMRLLALTGQRSAAMVQYEACVRILNEELDVAPAQETVRLYEQIRGGHRTSDPETGFLRETRFPASRHNLPAPVSSFVGRERELGDLRRLLADPHARLVTVVGAGGMGKTRLALEAARAELDQLAVAEARLVELAPVTEGAAVPRAVAAALGVQEQPGQPLPETIAGALQGRKLLLVLDNCEHVLGGVAPLAALLLSRCPELKVLTTSREPLRMPGEHLYETPPLALPELDEPTERLLGADAIQLFCQRASEVQTGFALEAADAPLAVEVCLRLDGMPLAIELAAARLHALSLSDLASRLNDRFRLLTAGSRTALPRQQTLRNTVEWSYALLGAAEQAVFDRLSVFAGSFSLAGAEAVCSGDGVQQGQVLDLLAGLVDRSLVSRIEAPDGATRYRLLETLRAYGQECLGERGDADAVAACHAWYYVLVAEAEEPELWACERGQISARQRLNAEAENLATAMRWSLAHRQPEAALRIGGALYFWTFLRANNEQYAEWLRLALAQGEHVAPLYQAKACWVVAVYAQNWGRDREFAACAHMGLDMAQKAGDATWIARTLYLTGNVADLAGDRSQARACYEQALESMRQCGDRVFIIAAQSFLAGHESLARRKAWIAELAGQAPYCLRTWLLLDLGWTTWALGDLEGARAHFQAHLAGSIEQDFSFRQGESWVALARIAAQRGEDAANKMLQRGRDLYRQIGQFHAVIGATREMGRLAWQCCDLEKASCRFQECLDLAREHRYPQEAVLAQVGLALVAGEWGEYEQASALCEQALPDLPPADGEAWAMALCARGRIALLRGLAAQAVEHYGASLTRLRPGESRPDICEVLEFLGWALAADGEVAEATRLLAFAERERDEMGIVLPPIDRPHHERAMNSVHAVPGEQGFAAVWAEGQAMGMEEAVAAALTKGEGI